MKKFIFAATLVFIGGVASVNAQSSANQEDLMIAALNAASQNQLTEMNKTVSEIESEELRRKLEEKLSSHLEEQIQAKFDSQLVFNAN